MEEGEKQDGSAEESEEGCSSRSERIRDDFRFGIRKMITKMHRKIVSQIGDEVWHSGHNVLFGLKKIGLVAVRLKS